RSPIANSRPSDFGARILELGFWSSDFGARISDFLGYGLSAITPPNRNARRQFVCPIAHHVSRFTSSLPRSRTTHHAPRITHHPPRSYRFTAFNVFDNAAATSSIQSLPGNAYGLNVSRYPSCSL